MNMPDPLRLIIKQWIIALMIGFFLVLSQSPFLFFVAAVVSFYIGIERYKRYKTSPDRRSPLKTPKAAPPVASPSPESAPVLLPERKMPEDLPQTLKCPACGANIKPTDKVCEYCGTHLTPLVELPEPAKLAAVQVGSALSILHPQSGQKVYRVDGRLLYTELWQASRGANVPWTPTGNYFAGFALQPGGYLLNWQERFYLLETRRPLTDMDIHRDFLPYARQFAQSNQTARVQFTYAGIRWQMADIGRFAIEFADGKGLHLRQGAIGRFIHAHSENRALVLEDFQSGGSGGQDTLWLGWLINEKDITF